MRIHGFCSRLVNIIQQTVRKYRVWLGSGMNIQTHTIFTNILVHLPLAEPLDCCVHFFTLVYVPRVSRSYELFCRGGDEGCYCTLILIFFKAPRDLTWIANHPYKHREPSRFFFLAETSVSEYLSSACVLLPHTGTYSVLVWSTHIISTEVPRA